MKTIAILPARYGSTRLPGKPLADIGGKPMVWHAYSRAAEVLGIENVYVATDDQRIVDAVTRLGGNALIVTEGVTCGTDRCARALDAIGRDAGIVLNLQPDEPFISPADIEQLMACFDDPAVEIATLARRFDPAEGFDELFSPDNPKVVFDSRGDACYFSRSIIPYVRDHEWRQWIRTTAFYMHVGTYGFRAEALRAVATLPPSPAETAERLEQLRWLHAGYRIRVAITTDRHISVDTPADLEAARCHYLNHRPL